MKVNKHSLIILPLLLLSTGCIVIPYSREFRPGNPTPHAQRDSQGNDTYPDPAPEIQLTDAATGQPLDATDAKVVILIHREKYEGLCCSSKSLGECQPLAYVEPLAKLPHLAYHQRGLIYIFYPIAGETSPEYSHATLLAYKPGYLPAPIRPDSPTSAITQLQPCPPDQSRPALLQSVRQAVLATHARHTADRVDDLLPNPAPTAIARRK